ncbi:TPA: dsDNA nuclease domain-containing protein [Salmonella enterica]
MESSNAGGVAAKLGFLYQDCAAALFVTEMLLDKMIQAVRCEVTDDIDILYHSHIEFVQVKTTDKPRWSISNVLERARGAQRKLIPESSIVHKSMKCATVPIDSCKFRILSPRDTKAPLDYLEIELSKRPGKLGRDDLVRELEKKMSNYSAPAGNSIAHWVDSCWWQIIPSMREIELTGLKNIRNAAFNLFGVILTVDAVAETIWINILTTMTKKSTLDTRVYVEDDKTYHRNNFLSWFKAEVLHLDRGNAHRKVYVHRKLPAILVSLRDSFPSPAVNRQGLALHQRYQLGQYRYEHIAKNVCQWFDELLLRPSEIADFISSTSTEKYHLLRSRLASNKNDLENFLGNALLHSVMRIRHNSQPIPATLYLDANDDVKVYENVHIVQRSNGGDELWLGVSKITKGSTVSQVLIDLRDALYNEILKDLDGVREKILDIKEDSYLLKHDVDEILDPSNSFEDHMDRFRFVIFFGYESEFLTVPESKGHEPSLYNEAYELFLAFISDLQSNAQFSALNIDLYLYPAPSFTDLCSLLDEKMREDK